MNGKLRGFGLALVAAFALGALAAPTVSAEGIYIGESTHTTIEGSQGEINELETSFGVLTCKTATFTGTMAAKEAAELTITPTYTECEVGGVNATVDMNGCQYKFKSPTETEQSAPADMKAEVQIVNCTKAMEITTSVCTVKVPAQTPSSPIVDLTNTASPPMEGLVTSTIEGIEYSYSGFLCGSGSAKNGAYRGTIKTQKVFAGPKPWISVKNVGGTAKEGKNGHCEFTANGQKCQLQFKNISTKTLRVLNASLYGTKATTRYKKVKENCVFNLAFGECTDELESIGFEAGTVNDYCLLVEDKGLGGVRIHCAILDM